MKIKMKKREVRESKKISLRELSRLTNITKSYLSCVERNEKNPSLAIIIRIAIALNVDEKEVYEIQF